MRCRLVGGFDDAVVGALVLGLLCVLCIDSASADRAPGDLYSGGGPARSGDARLHSGMLGGSFGGGTLEGGGYVLTAGPFLMPEPLPPGIAGDFNDDASVDFTDYLMFAAAYGSTSDDADFDPIYDLDEGGSVDFADFIAFAQVYGG